MITIVLQAGGQSSRMGMDKGLLPFLGKPLIRRLIDRFLATGADLLIISNSPDNFQDQGLPVFSDVIPGRGALGGLYTALAVATTPLVGLVAVDMPFASPELIQVLATRIQESNWDVVIPSTIHGLEPLHAVYHRERCLAYVREAIDQDQWRMNAWHHKARVKILDADETLNITGSEYTFLNLNTPEEFRAAEKFAREFDLG